MEKLLNSENSGEYIDSIIYQLKNPWCRLDATRLLCKAYKKKGKIDKAYSLIKKLYESTNDGAALMDFVKLLLDMREVDEAKKYVNDAHFSNSNKILTMYPVAKVGMYENMLVSGVEKK